LLLLSLSLLFLLRLLRLTHPRRALIVARHPNVPTADSTPTTLALHAATAEHAATGATARRLSLLNMLIITKAPIHHLTQLQESRCARKI
jgi:hypothetical protein